MNPSSLSARCRIFGMNLLCTLALALPGLGLAGCGSGSTPANSASAPPTPAATVSLSSTSLNFSSVNLGVSSAAQSLTLTNVGTATLIVASATVSGPNASTFSVTNTCTLSVAIGGGCIIRIIYTPDAVGLQTATLTIIDNATNSPQTVPLSGTGVGTPVVSLSAASLSFGSITVGASSATQTVTISNTGNAPLAISSIALTGTITSFSLSTTCGQSLAAGASCTASIIFSPKTAGAQTATLNITDNAAGSLQTVALSGTGLGVPAVSVSTIGLNFGSTSVGASSAAQTVTLTSNGTATLTLTSIAITGTNATSFSVANACGTTLAVGSSCTVAVTFSPAATGMLAANLVLTDNAPTSPQSVALSGTGTGTPILTIMPASLTFAATNVGSSSAPQTLALSNTGNAVLTLSSTTITGANANFFSVTNTCGGSIAVGATCTASVVFSPGSAGSQTASLVLASNATASPQSVALSGSGMAVTNGVPAVSGTVYIGNAAVAKGTVSVYAIGMGSQQLLGTATIDVNGNFGFNSAGKPSFSCTTGQPLYLYATNLVPHAYATETPASTASALLVAPGTCGSFSTVVLNELTTVAGVSALTNFILGQGTFFIEYGFPQTSFLPYFNVAQANAALMVNPSTGVLGTDPSLLAEDKAKLNSLADTLYACTNSDPALGSGTGTPCAALYAASISAPTTATGFPTPLNAVYAMISIAKFGSSIAPVFALPNASQPYQPIWTAPPLDFVVRISPATAAPTLTTAYVTGQAMVTMVSATSTAGSPGAVIWYTTDGSTPTIGGGTSTLYLSPVSFYSNVTIKAIAQEFGMAASAVSPALALNITAGPHLNVTFPAGTINTGTSAVGTVSLSGPVTTSLSVTLASPAYKSLSFSASAAQATTTVTLSSAQPTATFTIYGLNAGTSAILAQAAGVAPGTGAIRSTSLIAGATTSVAKLPIYGFSAVNSQSFNNNSAPVATENDAYQVNIADPAKFAASIINVTWNQLEPAQGSFDFSYVDQALANIAAGNKSNNTHVTAKIRFWAGNNAPSWLINGEPDGQGGFGVYVGSVGTDNHAVLEALFWSADYEAHFKAMMSALAAEYDQRTMVQEMVVSPCTNATDEPFILDQTTMLTGYAGHPSMRTAGFTDAARERCLQDAAADYTAWTLTPLYLPFNPLSTTDAGHSISYIGFAWQQMQAFVGAKLGQAIIANQDLQPIPCLFDSTCASSGSIFDMFPVVTYTVGGVTYPANVSVQITPQGQGFTTKCSPDNPDYTCYKKFVEWGVTPAENGPTTSTAGFHILEMELYPTIDDRFPGQTGATVIGNSNLTNADLGNLNTSYFPKFIP